MAHAQACEQLGGYFLIDVSDRAGAIAWAARCPRAANGVVKVRPGWPMGEGVAEHLHLLAELR